LMTMFQQLFIFIVYTSITSAQFVLITSGNIPVLEGEWVSLNCSHNYGNNVQYKWIISHTPKHYYYQHESFLEFQQIDRNDDMFVSCQIRDPSARLSKTSRPLLIKPYYMDEPTLKVVSKSTWNVKKDDRVTIACSVKSRPQNQFYELQRNGKTFHFSSSYNFGNIRQSDEGHYKCVTHNEYFKKTSLSYNLSVGGLSANTISAMTYVAGVFFPIFILLLVCIFACRRYSIYAKKRQLAVANTTDVETNAPTVEQVKATSLNNIGSNNIARMRDTTMIPPSYDEAVGATNYGYEPPSYNEAVTQPTIKPATSSE